MKNARNPRLTLRALALLAGSISDPTAACASSFFERIPNPDPPPSQQFGFWFDSDGQRILATTIGQTGTRAVHLFERDTSGAWVHDRELVPTTRPAAYLAHDWEYWFGQFGVGIDGDLAVVSAWGEPSMSGTGRVGAIYVWERDATGAWHDTRIEPSDAALQWWFGGDGVEDISDPLAALGYLFLGSSPPLGGAQCRVYESCQDVDGCSPPGDGE